eukprot:TRINITY_DN3298_c0_g1_i1.p1 TRINITY_DN3298_c0_g1~~TRINITY_DN3298_c0_g1_i1.p1  ORF type:complete len:322 (-),score=77.99 TRINITY_DN3298_c0_g1_i1:69-1034(-)
MRFVLSVLLSSILWLSSASVCPTSNRKVLYLSYANINWNDFGSTVKSVSDSGYNVMINAFFLPSSDNAAQATADSAQAWQMMGTAAQKSTVDYVHSKGGCVLLSIGGATSFPFSIDGASVGRTAAQYALAQNYDGVDFDIENIAKGFKSASGADVSQWLIAATNAARSVLGSSKVITHAPQAPYFGPIGGSEWTGVTGGYSTVEKHSQIDWYNVQFYNQGAGCYVDYNGLFENSCSNFPQTSVKEIMRNAGVPANKIVVGKPVTTSDAGSGYLTAGEFGNLLRQAYSEGLEVGGFMGWKWEAGADVWAHQVGDMNQLAQNA